MPTVTITKRISAPSADVFRVAVDFSQLAQRVRGIDRVEMLTEGATQVGTRFRETRTMMGKEATEEMWVTVFEPPQKFCVEAESCGCHYKTWHYFMPIEEGTEVRLEFSGRPVSVLGWLMTPLTSLMLGSIKKMISADLDDLKSAVETGH